LRQQLRHPNQLVRPAGDGTHTDEIGLEVQPLFLVELKAIGEKFTEKFALLE
jgi:hypothetical protein